MSAVLARTPALVLLAGFLAAQAGCLGLLMDLMQPEYDNLVPYEDFTPDPKFGLDRPQSSPTSVTFSAADIAKVEGVVCLELVIGPRSNIAGSASGLMVEYGGKPHVLSAGHIAKGPKFEAIYAYFSEGRKSPEEVEIVVADETLDLCLLRFKDAGFRYASYPRLGESAALRKGDKVFPYGSPFGFDFMVREGVISKLDVGPIYRGFKQPQVIFHDATLNPGDSGGPLFNDRGEVIGINVMGIHYGGHRAVSTMYASIPIDDVKSVLRKVARSGYIEHPYMGWRVFETAGLNPLNYRDKGIPKPLVDGLMVYDVEPGTPADRAGLKIGDIIRSIDGWVPRTPNDVARHLLLERSLGDEAEVRVYREVHRTDAEIRPDKDGYLAIYYTHSMKTEELTIKVKLQ
jgi:serine protease Do